MRWLSNQFVEAEKARQQAYEQQRVQYLDMLAGKALQAAETSAKAAKLAAMAALLAAASSIGQLIVAGVAVAVK